MFDISVCVLCYGDHYSLAHRCLSSIEAAREGMCHVNDFRIGLHNVCKATRNYVHDWAKRNASNGRMSVVYEPKKNVLKYPTMRRMFHDAMAPLASYTMWFDDDTFLTGGTAFWSDVLDALCGADMIGQHWYKGFVGNMYDWILSQSWANKFLKSKGKAKFCTGGWWTIDSSILKKFDWPAPEIRHKGGDMALGELFRHANLRMGKFDRGVRINADEQGQHSKAQRRGLSVDSGPEREVGWDYMGVPLSTAHQRFEVGRTIYAGW